MLLLPALALISFKSVIGVNSGPCQGGYVKLMANGGICEKANANTCTNTWTPPDKDSVFDPAKDSSLVYGAVWSPSDTELVYAVKDPSGLCTYSCVPNAEPSAVNTPASHTDSCKCKTGYTKSQDGLSCFEECDQQDHEHWSGNKAEPHSCRLTGCEPTHKFVRRSCKKKGCMNTASSYYDDAAEWGPDKDYCPDASEYKEKYGSMNDGCPWNTFKSNTGICTGCPSVSSSEPDCEAKQHWIDVALGSGNAVSLNVDPKSLWYDACSSAAATPKADAKAWTANDVDRCAASCLRGYGYQHTLGLWCPLDECRTAKSLKAAEDDTTGGYTAKEFYNCSKAFSADKVFVYHINGATTHFDLPASTVSTVSVADLEQDGAGESEALDAIASGEAVVRPESGIYHSSQKGCHQCSPHDLQDSSNPCHKAGQWNCQTTVELPAFEA